MGFLFLLVARFMCFGAAQGIKGDNLRAANQVFKTSFLRRQQIRITKKRKEIDTEICVIY